MATARSGHAESPRAVVLRGLPPYASDILKGLQNSALGKKNTSSDLLAVPHN